MLSQEKRELLIRTYEKTHDANLTAEIFGVNRSTVYARVKEYKETGSTELHTSQRGRKRKITTEDDERIKKLINENNDITIREIKETLELDVSDEAIRHLPIKFNAKWQSFAQQLSQSKCWLNNHISN